MAKPNADKSFRTALLIGKYLRGQLSEKEKKELDAWISDSHQNRQLFEELCSADSLEPQLAQFENVDNETGWQNIQYKIASKSRVTKKKPIFKLWWQSAAAVLVLALAVWQLMYHSFNKPGHQLQLASKYGDDMMPGNEKAELVLSDGTTIRLDAGTDTAFKDKGSSIKRTSNGAIVYSKGATGDDARWNTIRIPNGGEYMVVLEDGTKVWLNAASSLHYPVRFTGKERRVELTEGEAYFEVAKNREKPFIVVAEKMQVQAVGTAFNVDSYANSESTNLITLAEGRIKVTAKNNTVFVEPGQQVKADFSGPAVSNGDVESALAWKNGLFIFTGTPLSAVMERVARWYDVKIEFDKTFKERKFFTGEIKRNVPVSKLLQMMEMTGIAKFRIGNNTITILPYTPQTP
jgi:transmembrane sensor